MRKTITTRAPLNSQLEFRRMKRSLLIEEQWALGVYSGSCRWRNGRDALPREPLQMSKRGQRGQRGQNRIIRCSASDGRCTPARPGLNVSTRLSLFLPPPRSREYRLYSVLSIIAPPVNVLRRTRRKPSTIRGAATDDTIGHPAAVRAGSASLPMLYHSQPHGAFGNLYQYDKNLIPARGRSSTPPALPDRSIYKTFACYCCCYCCGCCQNTESRSTIMLWVLTTRLE
jgi:hypothetical protein